MGRVKRIPVTSTSLRSVGFDPEHNVLEVEFRNGRVYQYFGVPRSVYDAFTAAESKGRFVGKYIVPVYRGHQVI